MATKRKSTAQFKSEKKQKKKLKDEEYNAYDCNMSLPVDKGSQCEKINNIGKSSLPRAKLMNEHSMSIISCFRKQKEQETKSVSCPVCERMVFYPKINQHLDGGCCEKFLVPCENDLAISKSQLCNKRSGQLLDIKCGEKNKEKCENDYMYEDSCRSAAVDGTTPASLLLEKSSLQTSRNDMFKSNTITDISKSNGNMTFNTCSENVNLISNSTSNVEKTKSSFELGKIVNEIENLPDFIAVKQIIIDGEKNSIFSKVSADQNNIVEPLDGNQSSSLVHVSSNVTNQVTNTNEGGSTNIHEPYYLQNFMLTLNTVLSHYDDRRLFDESDDAIVKSFQNLSDSAKKLYVRLFQRKFKWFPTAKIQYQRIGDVLGPFFQELIDCGE